MYGVKLIFYHRVLVCTNLPMAPAHQRHTFSGSSRDTLRQMSPATYSILKQVSIGIIKS